MNDEYRNQPMAAYSSLKNIGAYRRAKKQI